MSAAPSSRIPVSIILPAFNEEAGIAEVLEGLQQVLKDDHRKEGRDYEILVVDDGSEDATASLAKKCGARVIRHPHNIGYGRSLLSGFEAAKFDWLLTLDADGSYPPEEILKLLPFAPDYDMVVGARQGSFFWGSPFKTFARMVYLRLTRFVAGVSIPDANSGLRLINRKVMIESMPITCYGFSMSTTLTLSFLQEGRFVRFTPVRYSARRGTSKVRLFRDILGTLQLMLKVILYYNPLKFTVYLALLPAGAATLFAVLFWQRRMPLDLLMSLLSALGVLFVLLMGCLLESLRVHRPGDPRERENNFLIK